VSRMRLRIVLGLALAFLLPLVVWVGYMGVQYPAAAAPAGLGALIGALRFARHHRDGTPPPLTDPGLEWRQLFGACLWLGILFGAVGYAAFAGYGIGVPDAGAVLGWRLFGGAVFGALAGVAAAWAASIVASVWLLTRRFRRRRSSAA